MSKAKELVESLKGLPENMLPKFDEAKPSTDPKKLETVMRNVVKEHDDSQKGKPGHKIQDFQRHIQAVKGAVAMVKKGEHHDLSIKRAGFDPELHKKIKAAVDKHINNNEAIEEGSAFDESQIEGVEISETEDKEYHVKKVKTEHGDTEHQVFHKDKHIGSVKGQLMWVKKNGKMTGGHNVGTVEHGISVLKKYHKAGKMD